MAALMLFSFALSFFSGVVSLLVRGVAGEDAARGILEAFPKLVGLLVLVGLMRFALHTHGRLWRRVADHYGAPAPDASRVHRAPEQVVIFGGGLAFRRFVPLRVGIHARGISLKLLPPFSFGCPPIYLRFDEMNVRPTSWYLLGESWAIRAAKAPDIDIIVDGKLHDWLRSQGASFTENGRGLATPACLFVEDV
ncbi:MAG: hypothetical protein ABR538_14855 [Candidatus Binatia bacterium]